MADQIEEMMQIGKRKKWKIRKGKKKGKMRKKDERKKEEEGKKSKDEDKIFLKYCRVTTKIVNTKYGILN